MPYGTRPAAHFSRPPATTVDEGVPIAPVRYAYHEMPVFCRSVGGRKGTGRYGGNGGSVW